MTVITTVIFEPRYGYLRNVLDAVGTKIRDRQDCIFIPDLS